VVDGVGRSVFLLKATDRKSGVCGPVARAYSFFEFTDLFQNAKSYPRDTHDSRPRREEVGIAGMGVWAVGVSVFLIWAVTRQIHRDIAAPSLSSGQFRALLARRPTDGGTALD